MNLPKETCSTKLGEYSVAASVIKGFYGIVNL